MTAPTITLEEALAKVDAAAAARGAAWAGARGEGVVERAGCWYLPVTAEGSQGVIVDKAGGRLHVLGFGLNLEDVLWGHERGFVGALQRLTITRVADMTSTVSYLSRLAKDGPPAAQGREVRRLWLIERLGRLPWTLQPLPLWLRIAHFRQLREETHWFEWEVAEATAEGEAPPQG